VFEGWRWRWNRVCVGVGGSVEEEEEVRVRRKGDVEGEGEGEGGGSGKETVETTPRHILTEQKSINSTNPFANLTITCTSSTAHLSLLPVSIHNLLIYIPLVPPSLPNPNPNPPFPRASA
jgi:hypothetical protein